jgi:hypothetical protein
VAVRFPNGGETLRSQSVTNLTWQTFTSLPVGSVTLKYSVNGGARWTTIATLTGNPGAYLWTVPTVNAASTNVLVDVILLQGTKTSLGEDSSDRTFTVAP